MFDRSEFTRLLEIENNLVKQQTQGLTTADTLIQPQPSGNCMNWVLGHTLDSQIGLLEFLGGHSPVERKVVERYRRESEPLRELEPGVLSLEELLAHHDAVCQALIARLGEIDDAELRREIRRGEHTMTVSWRVLFAHFHYTYHLGQLELLRQAAGHVDKVI